MNNVNNKTIRIAVFLIFLFLGFLWTGISAISSQSTEDEKGTKWAFSDSLTDLGFVDSLPVTFLTGKFNPASHTDFVRLQGSYAGGNARGAWLQVACLEAFLDMRKAAAKAGVSLTILSATRNFDRQKAIWEGKWTGQRLVDGKDLSKTTPDPEARASAILRWSSMPGTSRHHWGTDVDLNAFSNAYFSSGKGLKEYEWLTEHAASFGFCQPYTEKGAARKEGYEEEKWHWSYTPLSQKYLIAYAAQVNATDIKGFKGSEVAEKIEVIRRYVFGVNTECF